MSEDLRYVQWWPIHLPIPEGARPVEDRDAVPSHHNLYSVLIEWLAAPDGDILT
jgi:hypothetical protein